MIFAVTHIARMVREAAGYSPEAQPLFPDCPSRRLTLDSIIENSLPAAIKRAYAEAPAALLLGSAVSMAHCGVYWHTERDSSYSGHMLVPKDFFQLAVFEMSDWSSAVYEAVDCRSKRYALTSSRFAALRGSPQRPMVALAQHPEGLALEFYSCSSTACTISKAAYIPLPAITDDRVIDIAPELLPEIISHASQIVLAHPSLA